MSETSPEELEYRSRVGGMSASRKTDDGGEESVDLISVQAAAEMVGLQPYQMSLWINDGRIVWWGIAGIVFVVTEADGSFLVLEKGTCAAPSPAFKKYSRFEVEVSGAVETGER